MIVHFESHDESDYSSWLRKFTFENGFTLLVKYEVETENLQIALTKDGEVVYDNDRFTDTYEYADAKELMDLLIYTAQLPTTHTTKTFF